MCFFKDASAEEFMTLFQFLTTTRLGSSITGQQELVNFAAEQADINQEFNLLDPESNPVDRLITCVKFVLPMFSVCMIFNSKVFNLEKTGFFIYK